MIADEAISFQISLDLVKDRKNSTLMQIIVDAPYFDNDTIPDYNKQFRSPQLWEHEVVELFISSHIVSNDVKMTPYTEVILGPHSHWLVIKHTGQENWSDCDDDILLESAYLPDTHIDYVNKRWNCQILIPIELLPTATHVNDNGDNGKTTLSWLVNAYAIHNTCKIIDGTHNGSNEEKDNRRYMAYNSVPGQIPRFHQLESFQQINFNS